MTAIDILNQVAPNWPEILEDWVNWLEAQETEILSKGQPLPNSDLEMARELGVAHPERVRVLEVDSIILPSRFNHVLELMSFQTGGSTLAPRGMCLRYGIWLTKGEFEADTSPARRGLLAHELTHTQQMEQCGSVREFTLEYAIQVIDTEGGYHNAPFEREAEANRARFERGSP